ncbi:MAG: miaA [Candidatus Taylorbacteria bacterium]|nr:miaA [Candidatus Taylorbacteria bacterium]
MPKAKPKIISIVGPTASGKSDLAVMLAKQFKGEVISADSRQVYTGLNIGSGKITKKEMMGIPHHLLDVVSPKKVFTVANFKKLANEKINEIVDHGHIPILCGGTGFYIDTVTKNILLPEVPPNQALRKKLEVLSLEKLQKMLMKLDQKRFISIDLNNKVRLIRAIEITKALGSVPKIKSKPLYDVLTIGILWNPESLRKRINLRLQKRIKIGMINEVKKLKKSGVSWKRLESLGLEYRYVAQFLQKKISKIEMIEKLQFEIWHYAKRQMTWFQKDMGIKWMRPTEKTKIKKEVKEFLK